MQEEPIVLESAHRHGVTEDDMLHALRNAVIPGRALDDDMTMFVGPGQDGTLIEVGVVFWHEGMAIAHAMKPARSKFL